MLVVGLMSGTSLDGIDAVLVRITEDQGLQIKFLAMTSLPYSKKLKRRIKNILPPNQGTVQELAYLNFYLGEKLAKAALKVISKAGFSPEEIALIGSHGQTVCNLPPGGDEFSPHARLQIGDISVIAVRTGITTVGDFRPADVAAGGEGAPLIPYFDYYMFRSDDKNRAVLNIGGIANVTYIPAGADLNQIQGFDTGPGNMVLDELVRLITDGAENFDRDGQHAAKGIPHPRMLTELMENRFVRRHPPKSAGREEFGSQFVQEMLKRAKKYGIAHDDLIATATAFTAEAIAYNCKEFLGPIDEVIVGGGGAYNRTLLDMLQKRFPNASVFTTEEYGIPIKAREAMGFALLAYQAFHRRPNNVPSVTGASHPVVMGKIAWGKLNYERHSYKERAYYYP